LKKEFLYNLLWITLYFGLLLQPVLYFLSRKNLVPSYLILIPAAAILGVATILFFIKNQLNKQISTAISSLIQLFDIKQNEIHKKVSPPKNLKQIRNVILQLNEFVEENIESLSLQSKELVAAYDALSEARNKYEQLLNYLEDEYFFYGKAVDGSIIYVSKSVENILGYKVPEYKKKTKDMLTDNPINKESEEYFAKSLKGERLEKFLIEVRDKNSEPHMLEIIEIPILNTQGEFVSVEGLAHDISDSYYSQELLREQELKYREVFNTASDFIYLYDSINLNAPGNFIETNLYMQTALGYTNEELLQITPIELDAAEIWNETHERKSGGKYERIWETKEGSILNVEISEHLFQMKGKQACIAVARDISDRKRALEEIKFMNEELINQKENLEALLDNLTQTQEQLVQSEKMAALGQLIAGVAHEINTPLGAIKASVGNMKDSLESTRYILLSLLQGKTKDNIELYSKALDLAQKGRSDYSSREKRELKREIRKKLKEQNIESYEIIADLLTYLEIFNKVDEIIELLRIDDAVEVLTNVRSSISLVKNTNTISIASEKASKVVFALKKYAHRDSLGEKVPTDIVDGIETVLTLYDNQIKQGISLVKDYAELPLTMCYQDEINQVWTNLIQNAIQAMSINGTLTIKALADEKFIEVSISDTGEGIEPTIKDKIFEPFFTTKPQGEGSGLGLDIVKKILDKHNGKILVESKLGEGSTFTIKLPLY
jgi:PAS domain S-box-containing protein